MNNRDDIRPALRSTDAVAWEIADGLVPYEDAVARMDAYTSHCL
jgi:hypothetical protein